MQIDDLKYYCCPITQQNLSIKIIKTTKKVYNNVEKEIVEEGILESGICFYPIIKGIPRLIVEAVYDYEIFLNEHLNDFEERKNKLLKEFKIVIDKANKKNYKSKKSFEQEWKFFNYEKDSTWNANPTEMFDRFLLETNETKEQLSNKIILDVGCGNGLLNNLIANCKATIIGFDFSLSIENAFERNTNKNAIFVQADVQFPPFKNSVFDIVHASGILIHTNNTAYSFSCIVPLVKPLGKLSIWVYHPRKNFIHNTFNFIRKLIKPFPFFIQFFFCAIFIFPTSFIIKKIKGNQQNWREMMIDILDWMTPEFRWEHSHDEVISWFEKFGFSKIKITTNEVFGFNTIGIKEKVTSKTT